MKNMIQYKYTKFLFHIMVNQYVWVGIVIGVFVAGIRIGYSALQGSSMPGPMNFGNTLTVEKDVVIGDSVTISDGVTVPQGTIIPAGSTLP